MALKRTHRFAVTIAGVGLAVGLVAGCSDNKSDSSTSGSTAASSAAGSTAADSSASNGSAGAAANDLVGSGCAAYAKANAEGPGSVSGMALDPVATAASNNPLLKQLTAAVSGKLNPKVDLVDTLNSGQYTVFAPVDDAFAKVDAATIDKLKTDDSLLKTILTYHVIKGQVAPSNIDGKHATLQGGEVDVTGSGNDIKVNGNSTVICGGVKTANATVYLIDSVLMPPMNK